MEASNTAIESSIQNDTERRLRQAAVFLATFLGNYYESIEETKELMLIRYLYEHYPYSLDLAVPDDIRELWERVKGDQWLQGDVERNIERIEQGLSLVTQDIINETNALTLKRFDSLNPFKQSKSVGCP